jgi:hypothetical protein
MSKEKQILSAAIVHPKMNSGKESVTNAEFGLLDARKAVLKPPHSRRWRDHRASPHRAKRLDCGAFTAAFPLVVHPKMISGNRVPFRGAGCGCAAQRQFGGHHLDA